MDTNEARESSKSKKSSIQDKEPKQPEDRGEESLPKKVFSILWASGNGFLEDNCLVLSGAVAFSAIQSIFPLILGFLAIGSIFLQDPVARQNFILLIYSAVPQLITLNIDFNALLKGWTEGAGWAGVLSFIALLWSASGVFGQIKFAINAAFHVERDQRNLAKQIGLQIVMLLILGGLLLIAFSVNILAGLIFSVKISLFGISPYSFSFVLPLLSFLIPLALEIAVFAILYKISPARRGVRWKPVIIAAVITGILFELLKLLFSLYVNIFGAANSAAKTYGAIGGVFVFLFFLFLASGLILFGAELAASMHNFRSGLGAAQTKDAVVETSSEEIDNELVPPKAARTIKRLRHDDQIKSDKYQHQPSYETSIEAAKTKQSKLNAKTSAIKHSVSSITFNKNDDPALNTILLGLTLVMVGGFQLVFRRKTKT